jgi:hypothetical protein
VSPLANYGLDLGVPEHSNLLVSEGARRAVFVVAKASIFLAVLFYRRFFYTMEDVFRRRRVWEVSGVEIA